MDVEKLYRCQQFFLVHLLPDRRCTFDVLEYQTSMDKFAQYYHAVSKEKPSCLADRFQIVGTMPVRRAAYRFASTRTNGQADSASHHAHSEAGATPSVPAHAWPPSVKKAAEVAERARLSDAAGSSPVPLPAPTPSSTSTDRSSAGAKANAGASVPGQLASKARPAARAKAGGKAEGKAGAKAGARAGAKAGAKADKRALECDGAAVAVVQPAPLVWRKGVAQVPFVVHFLPNAGDASFGKPAAASLVALMRAQGIRWLFLVTVGGITPYAARELATWCCFEVWPLMACLCPAVTHQAFPPHRLLGPAEKKAFYAKWKVTPAQVSRMQVTDAAAKYFGYVPGDVVAVRRNTFVGFLDAFRVVVHVPI